MSELRVFIADDEAPARERLKELLADLAGELPTRIVGEARNGIEVMEGFPASGAQVLLLDIAMPGMGGGIPGLPNDLPERPDISLPPRRHHSPRAGAPVKRLPASSTPMA